MCWSQVTALVAWRSMMQLSDRSWSQVIGNLGAQLEQKTQALKDFQTKHKIRVRGRSDVRAKHLVCCPPVSVLLTLGAALRSAQEPSAGEASSGDAGAQGILVSGGEPLETVPE